MKNDIKTSIQKTFESFNRIQRETNITFSGYGPVVPFLLLGVLQSAINRQVGFSEHSSELLNISKGLYKPVPSLKLKDIEPIITCVSDEVGDTTYTLRSLFNTSLFAFDSISNEFNEAKFHLDGFYDLDFENNAKEIVETALKLSSILFARGVCISNPSIALLARDILDVKPGETFSDFVCGIGLSSTLIAGDVSDVKICLSDLSSSSYAISCACCFIMGHKNFGKNEDSLSAEHFHEGMESDKIFTDPPLRVKLGNTFDLNGIKIKEASCSAIMKSVEKLKEGGTAVVAINTGFTYGTQFCMDEIRKYLLDNKFVSAVISLPAMWPGAGVLTTLMVLSKKQNTDISMIELSGRNNDSNLFEYSREVPSNTLTPEGLNTILSMLSKRKNIPGMCATVSYEKVVANNYLMLPNMYIENTLEKRLSTSEIDVKIKDTISELQSLIAQL